MLRYINIFIAFIFLTGCDPVSENIFSIKNNSDTILIISYKAVFLLNDSSIDTTLYLEPKDSIKIVYENIGTVMDEKEIFLNDFKTFSIKTNSGNDVKKNVYNRENWSYTGQVEGRLILVKYGKNIYEFKVENGDLE